ncbi:MAG TPA: hypothetical protein VFV35_02220, partial [Acidimicrobiales bacterium]|nr:hypothetical protein [Acidimicrobiales bacterium]
MASPSGWRELGAPARPRPNEPVSPFQRLARVHALAMGGDALVTVALAGSLFFSISPTAARGRVMLSLVLTMAPFAVVAPFLGPAIDRSRAGRRLILVGTTIGRAAACVAMIRVIDELLLFPAAFAVLVLSKTYSVAKSATVPAVVDDESRLVEANSKLSIVSGIAGFVASLPGVALLQLLGPEWTLGLAAGCFVAAGAASLRLPAVAAAVGARDSPPGADGAGVDDRASRPAPRSVETAAVATALLRTMVGFLTFLVAFG